MGITHEWNGTVLTITSDSGTSSADLKGAKGDDGVRGPQGIAGTSSTASIIIPNGFSLINVGSQQIAASSETDSFTLAAGDNITLTANNKTITIGASIEFPSFDIPDGYVIDGGTWDDVFIAEG